MRSVHNFSSFILAILFLYCVFNYRSGKVSQNPREKSKRICVENGTEMKCLRRRQEPEDNMRNETDSIG